MYVVSVKRAVLLLLSTFLLGACTVVHDTDDATTSADVGYLLGLWRADDSVDTRNFYIHRFAFFADRSYERWVVDSASASSVWDLTEEHGVWDTLADTAHILLTPTHRMTWNNAGTLLSSDANTDTAICSKIGDTLKIEVHDTTLKYLAD